MTAILKIAPSSWPPCSQLGCKMLAMDGYCEASCCLGKNAAYCSEHSHRPTMLLEVLGHAATKSSFTREEMETVIKSMWAGAGMVFEASGYLRLQREVEIKRRDQQRAEGRERLHLLRTDLEDMKARRAQGEKPTSFEESVAFEIERLERLGVDDG